MHAVGYVLKSLVPTEVHHLWLQSSVWVNPNDNPLHFHKIWYMHNIPTNLQ